MREKELSTEERCARSQWARDWVKKQEPKTPEIMDREADDLDRYLDNYDPPVMDPKTGRL